MSNQAIDAAALRLYYLQQLGVNLYVPREVPRDVATEVATDVATDVLKETIGTDETLAADLQNLSVMQAAPTLAEKVAVAGSRLALLHEADGTAKAAVSKVDRKFAATGLAAAPVSAAATQDEITAIAPFQLLFCMPEPGLAVALQIPALAKPALPEAEARLLQNLLRWLGVRHEGALAAMLHFKWPLPGMPAADAKTAGRNLQVFLQQATAARPLQRLLLLGQGPAHCLEAATSGAALPYQSWATHSLAEMLAVPELKREVWRQLLTLHGQL